MAYQTKDGRWYSTWRDDYGKQHKKYFGHGPQARQEAEVHDLQVKAAKIRGE